MQNQLAACVSVTPKQLSCYYCIIICQPKLVLKLESIQAVVCGVPIHHVMSKVEDASVTAIALSLMIAVLMLILQSHDSVPVCMMLCQVYFNKIIIF